jgi:hypothetical protein
LEKYFYIVKVSQVSDVAHGPLVFPMGFFMGQLIGVKTLPKSHGVLCFKVRYLKNYNQYRCNLVNFVWAENPPISWKEFTSIFQKMVGESPDF